MSKELQVSLVLEIDDHITTETAKEAILGIMAVSAVELKGMVNFEVTDLEVQDSE